MPIKPFGELATDFSFTTFYSITLLPITLNTMYYQNTDKFLISVDCIIFGFHKKELHVLLTRRPVEPKLNEKNFIIFASVIGLCFLILSPFPHRIDEYSHYLKSYIIANGKLYNDINSDGRI